MNNPIKTIVNTVTSGLKAHAIRLEKERVAKLRESVEAREKELQALEKERVDLQARRDLLLNQKTNLENTKMHHRGYLDRSLKKTESLATPGHFQGPVESFVGRGVVNRIITNRTYEFGIRNFLENVVPVIEKQIVDDLKKVDAEIEAFEKRAID